MTQKKKENELDPNTQLEKPPFLRIPPNDRSQPIATHRHDFANHIVDENMHRGIFVGRV